MVKKIFITLLILAGSAQNAPAYEVSLGAFAAAWGNPYRGVDSDWIALPYASFDSEYVFATFPSAGAHLVKSEVFSVDFKAIYLPHEFKPRDSSHSGMKRLNRRHATLGVGVSAKLDTAIGSFEAESAVDVLDKSNGITLGLIYSNPIPVASRVMVGPKLGAVWHNKKHNEYYLEQAGKSRPKAALTRTSPATA